MNQNSTDIASRYNPMAQQSDRRNWFDCDLRAGTSSCSGVVLPTNGDGIPQDNEIGPTGNRNLGSPLDGGRTRICDGSTTGTTT